MGTFLVYNFVPINWLWSGFISPRIRTFEGKRFHRLFSKKKRSKSGGVPLFPRREHVLAVIPSRVGNDQLSIHFPRLLDYLKSSENYCPRKLFSGSNSSPEKSSPENIALFLPQKSVLLPALCIFTLFFFESKFVTNNRFHFDGSCFLNGAHLAFFPEASPGECVRVYVRWMIREPPNGTHSVFLLKQYEQGRSQTVQVCLLCIAVRSSSCTGRVSARNFDQRCHVINRRRAFTHGVCVAFCFAFCPFFVSLSFSSLER